MCLIMLKLDLCVQTMYSKIDLCAPKWDEKLTAVQQTSRYNGAQVTPPYPVSMPGS